MKSFASNFPPYFGFVLVMYPAIIRMMYLIRQHFEPFYMNGSCLMDLVRVSAPEHYSIHPLWKLYQKSNFTNTCEAITNDSLDNFFLKTFQNGQTELYFLYAFIASLAITGISFILYRMSKFSFCGLGSFLSFVALAYCQGSLFHSFSHYQNDLTHLNGNVMHHSEFRIDGSNESLVATLPPGLLYLFVLNSLIVYSMMYGLLNYYQLDTKLYLAISTIVIPAKMLFNMKVIHPYIHKYHESWYPWPLKLVFRDYHGHILCHHKNGYCLGDMPGLCMPYDYLMMAHAKLYETGLFVYQQASHYTLNIFLDYCLILLTATLAFCLVYLVACIVPKLPSDAAKTGKKRV